MIFHANAQIQNQQKNDVDDYNDNDDKPPGF